MLLFHAGYSEIRSPDVRHGRKNADFGQGFYTTADEAFARRWARERSGVQTIVNVYELELNGLRTQRFERDAAWFDYIYANRAGKQDRLADVDVVIGPIANDTLFDTFGILTSGFLSRDAALQLLMLGPLYTQVALKTEKAAAQLRWLSASALTADELAVYRKKVALEEAEYQKLFAQRLERLLQT